MEVYRRHDQSLAPKQPQKFAEDKSNFDIIRVLHSGKHPNRLQVSPTPR